jgi:succinate dehydrogenase / fumarate reductase flavoprotein subunit
LETLVFGKAAGLAAAEYAAKGVPVAVTPADVERSESGVRARMARKDGVEPLAYRNLVQEVMDRWVGIFRDPKELEQAWEALGGVRRRLPELRIVDESKVFNLNVTEALEAEHLIDLAEVVVAGAIARKESRGAHARRDFPKRDDVNWMKHTIASYRPEGPQLSYAPVGYTRWDPKERVY